jgi:hypothetical protein
LCAHFQSSGDSRRCRSAHQRNPFSPGSQIVAQPGGSWPTYSDTLTLFRMDVWLTTCRTLDGSTHTRRGTRRALLYVRRCGATEATHRLHVIRCCMSCVQCMGWSRHELDIYWLQYMVYTASQQSVGLMHPMHAICRSEDALFDLNKVCLHLAVEYMLKLTLSLWKAPSHSL